MQNKIIVNADDFGLSESSVNAIAEAFEKNLISSTTALANGEFIEYAFNAAVKNGFADKIGVHLNLTEGTPLTEKIKSDPFFCENGVFHGRINRLKKPKNYQTEEIREELTAQIIRLKDIGFSLTHADSHHHIHTDIFFENTIKEVLFSFGITKIRLHRNFGKIKLYKRIVKKLYNDKLIKQGFKTTEKMGSLEDLSLFPETAEEFLTEIMVHPDYDEKGEFIDRIDLNDDGKPFGGELEEIKKYLIGFKLVSYADI